MTDNAKILTVLGVIVALAVLAEVWAKLAPKLFGHYVRSGHGYEVRFLTRWGAGRPTVRGLRATDGSVRTLSAEIQFRPGLLLRRKTR